MSVCNVSPVSVVIFGHLVCVEFLSNGFMFFRAYSACTRRSCYVTVVEADHFKDVVSVPDACVINSACVHTCN